MNQQSSNCVFFYKEELLFNPGAYGGLQSNYCHQAMSGRVQVVGTANHN